MVNALKKGIFSTFLAVCSISSFAATSLETPAFSLKWTPERNITPSLISYENDTYKFSIPEFNLYATDIFYSSWSADIHGIVKDGYRIKSVSISGNASAGAHLDYTLPAWLTNCSDCTIGSISPGYAGANGHTEMILAQNNQETTLEYGNDESLNYGTEQFKLTSNHQLTGEFDLYLSISANAPHADGWVIYSTPDSDDMYFFSADSYFSFTDYALEIEVAQISPVPEPATYGMLLGGLGILGFAASRRKA